jgi:hypothetical protein
MPVRKILRFVLPLISVTCLGIGYARTGLWIAALVTVFSLLAWLPAIKWSFGFLPACALVLSVSLAAAGLLTGGGIPLWMLVSAALSVAGWDMVLWNSSLADNSASTHLTLMEGKHYQSLAAALGLGLLAIIAGRLVHFQIPFSWMVVLVILALFSLERIRHILMG